MSKREDEVLIMIICASVAAWVAANEPAAKMVGYWAAYGDFWGAFFPVFGAAVGLALNRAKLWWVRTTKDANDSN